MIGSFGRPVRAPRGLKNEREFYFRIARFVQRFTPAAASIWRALLCARHFPSLIVVSFWCASYGTDAGRVCIYIQQVFVVKTKPNGLIEKFKARIVAQGFSQKFGVDYNETFWLVCDGDFAGDSTTSKSTTVVQILTTRLVLNIAASRSLKIKQLDIKTAFLYGELNETIYMRPPSGYEKNGILWLLNRSLYGLKQSPRMWN